ncbi:MAG: DUF2249 domain-containing protein [Haloarcula sp.]
MSTDQRDTVRELDVRDVDGEPFGHIMDALDDVGESEALRLVNSFEPVPLYDVLAKRGYQYDTEQVGDEEWHVTIRPE